MSRSDRWGPRPEMSFEEAEADLVKRSDAVTYWLARISQGFGVDTPGGVFRPTERGRRYARRRFDDRRKLETAFSIGDVVIVSWNGQKISTTVRVAPWSLGDEWLIGIQCQPRFVRLEAVKLVAKATQVAEKGKAA